jgi:ABC-type lipoprotein export system ATPase subunit
LIAGEKKEQAMHKASELLEEMGLKDRMYHRPMELSGGEQQRLAVARALVNSPRVVLADEPTGNLDQKSAESLIELLVNLNKNKKQTFIIATHNLKLSKIADRVFEMREGKASLNNNPNN